MAKAYLVCTSYKFNEKDYYLPIQGDLLDVEGEPETFIKFNNKNFHRNFDQYICHHDFRHNRSGRVFKKDFTYYFEPLDFYTYHNPNNDLTLVQTKTEIAIDFIQKLRSTNKYDMEPVDIDFNSMIPHIPEVGGAWIANLKRAHLKTAGYFGPHVNKSDEYKEAAREGNVSSIQMNYIGRATNKEYTVTISKKGSIVLYDSFNTIEEEIDLIHEIYNHLINPHVVV